MRRRTKPDRHWAAFLWNATRLFFKQPQRTADLVTQSYDAIAAAYDDAWTSHMREYSLAMLDTLAPPNGANCLDLTCGTGFVTAELARRSGRRAVGVDTSSGMLAAARQAHGEACEFIQADAAEYLANTQPGVHDVITCAWGLGYSRPWRIVRHAARVLDRGGRLGIIDNTTFSLAEVLWPSILTFAEYPQALTHVMRVRFLPASWALTTMMRLCGFRIVDAWDGRHTYYVPDGQTAIARLRATGAAAGFEFATDAANRNAVFDRFAEIIEEKYATSDGIPITHRYLAVIGERR